MRRLSTTSTLSIFGILTALLPGCPIWTDNGSNITRVDAGRDSNPFPTDNGPANCTSDSQCGTFEYCNTTTNTCVPGTRCIDSTNCPAGSYCGPRGICVSGCENNTDCQAVHAGFICNSNTGTCQPPGCTANNECPTGQSCVAGGCRPDNTLCRFSYECGAGLECVDGRCLTSCGGAATCPSGLTCVNGYCQNQPGSCTTTQCPSGQACLNGTCSSVCTTDAMCGAGNFCDNGVCRVDDRRPDPFCTPPNIGCNQNTSVCVDGICRIQCPATARDGTPNRDRACQEVDFNFTRCDTTISPAICRYSNEVSPQCRRSTDCASGQTCINAFCR